MSDVRRSSATPVASYQASLYEPVGMASLPSWICRQVSSASASTTAASSSFSVVLPARFSGRSNGVSERKSQTPARSGAPHAVRGTLESSAVWAVATTGASATAAARANSTGRVR